MLIVTIGIPEHLRDKTFIYRDNTNSYISEFQEAIQLQISKLVNKSEVEVIVKSSWGDSKYLSNANGLKPAIATLSAIKPFLENKESRNHMSIQKHNWFVYNIPYTNIPGKAHSALLQEQYKRKFLLRVNESFPCVFVRQEVVEMKILELHPIEVAMEDIYDRVQEIKVFLAMESISDQSILQEMMRIAQGSILPQINAGVAVVAKVFLEDSIISEEASVIVSTDEQNSLRVSFKDCFD